MISSLKSCDSMSIHDAEVVVVEDEGDIRKLIEDILKDDGYRIKLFADGFSAMRDILSYEPSVVLLDIWLRNSDIDGLGVLEKIRDRYPHLPVIVISGHGNISTAIKSLRLGAYDYIEKPFSESRLRLVTSRAIEASKLRKENINLRATSESDKLIGSSSEMKKLMIDIERVAITSSRVLIRGMVGTEISLVAKTIHNRSKFSRESMIIISPLTFVSEDYMSNIFGEDESDNIDHNLPPKIGLIERANGGTLFVDEISETPKDFQLKLLRMLQDGKIYRKNGKVPVDISVRILCSTTKDIEGEIANGTLNGDLFYRINVVSINIPSLSSRKFDIPEICDFYMQETCKRMRICAKKFSKSIITAMQFYRWPGNTQQLRNVIEWMAIMSPSDMLEVNHLPPEITSNVPMSNSLGAEVVSLPLKDAREEFERQYLVAQLSRFGGNVSKTAEFIGMERSALHRKMKSLGL